MEGGGVSNLLRGKKKRLRRKSKISNLLFFIF